jgi:putative FmdB family regulatory protein
MASGQQRGDQATRTKKRERMPTYDYECDHCGHKFELFQSISDPVHRKCPECKKSKLRRLFGTGAAIVFKGSGFYQTDYRSDSYKKAASADAPGGGESKASGNSDASGAKSESSSGDKSSSEKTTSDKPRAPSKSTDKKSGRKSSEQ